MTGRSPVVDHGRMLDVLGIEGRLLIDTARRVLPDQATAEAPGCPGFVVRDVVRHVAAVYRTVVERVGGPVVPATSAVQRGDPRVPDEKLADHLAGSYRDLIAELPRHQPSDSCSTWWPGDRTHGFWRRRCVHETTVHRVDVQAATGGPVDPIADDIALDGIDEVLLLWFGYRLGLLRMSSPQPGHVVLSAADRHWSVSFGHGTVAARRVPPDEAGRADARISAPPAQLYLWAWGRLPDQSVVIEGDGDAAAQLWTLLRPATQ